MSYIARGECSGSWLTQVSYSTLDSNGGELGRHGAGDKFPSRLISVAMIPAT